VPLGTLTGATRAEGRLAHLPFRQPSLLQGGEVGGQARLVARELGLRPGGDGERRALEQACPVCSLPPAQPDLIDPSRERALSAARARRVHSRGFSSTQGAATDHEVIHIIWMDSVMLPLSLLQVQPHPTERGDHLAAVLHVGEGASLRRDGSTYPRPLLVERR
jgi:hypothetical protein